jgi:sulfur-oxidizing protein SoxY
MQMVPQQLPSRRTIVGGSVGLVTLALVPGVPVFASEDLFQAARREILNGRTPRRERVRLEAPELAENGNAVTVTVEADSPMTAADHVTAIHLLAEKNPLANVVTVWLGPRAGKARLVTTIRLADTQQVTALVELSTGDVLEASANVVVTIAACLDAG